MRDLKSELIVLGKQKPELKRHIRPVLMHVSASDKETFLGFLPGVGSGVSEEIIQQAEDARDDAVEGVLRSADLRPYEVDRNRDDGKIVIKWRSNKRVVCLHVVAGVYEDKHPYLRYKMYWDDLPERSGTRRTMMNTSSPQYHLPPDDDGVIRPGYPPYRIAAKAMRILESEESPAFLRSSALTSENREFLMHVADQNPQLQDDIEAVFDVLNTQPSMGHDGGEVDDGGGRGRDLGYGKPDGKRIRRQLDKIEDYAGDVKNKLRDDDELPGWIKDKINVMNDDIVDIKHYLQGKLDE